MKMQQALFQQQEFMVKQQAILQETFAQLRNNMQGSTLPVLPPLPTLPNFKLCKSLNFSIMHLTFMLEDHESYHLILSCFKFSQSGQGSNNCVVGGSSPGQASPVTPTTVHVASTSPQQCSLLVVCPCLSIVDACVFSLLVLLNLKLVHC